MASPRGRSFEVVRQELSAHERVRLDFRYDQRMGNRRRGTLILVAAVAIAAVTAGGYFGYRAYADAKYNAQACDVIREQILERGEVVTTGGDRERVAVIGDSYSAGDGLDDYTAAWPFAFASQTGHQVSVDGIGWTGFVNEGVCGDQAFGTRVDFAAGADLVIVQGGLNDARIEANVSDATTVLLESIEAPRIVVVGPVDAPGIEGEASVDADLRGAVEAAGGEYVSALGWNVEFGPDRTHLTERGHVEFAARVSAAVD